MQGNAMSEPASDIDTVLVDSLKALDPNRPIREARFSSESAPGPFHHGIRGRGGTIFAAALPSYRQQVQWNDVPCGAMVEASSHVRLMRATQIKQDRRECQEDCVRTIRG